MKLIDFFCLISRRTTAFLAGFLVFYASLVIAEPPTPAEFIDSSELVLTLSDKWLEPSYNFKKNGRAGKDYLIDGTDEEKPANIDCGMDTSPTDKFIPNGFAGECSFNVHY